MTAETFFANFGHLADAPNGVQKLRELILQLAVQGKLVLQNEADEPASFLLDRIRDERIGWMEEKRIRKSKPLPKIDSSDHLFYIPKNWVWTRLGEYGDWGAGATPSRQNSSYYGGRMPWLKSGELNDSIVSESAETITTLALKECSLRIDMPGDVLIAMYGATIGKVAILEIEATTNQAVCACTCLSGIYNHFLFVLLKAYRPFFTGQGAGGAQPNISREKIIATPVPLPPLEEQKRIVAKVDQLMALCNELEARQQKQQRGRMRLNNSALNALLTAREPGEFANHWQRICDNFDPLYNHPATITKLRAAILQLAVQGKLVPQDPNDEPASVLLERIKTEKERLVKEKVIRKPKPLPTIEDENRCSSLPDKWDFCRLGSLCFAVSDGPHFSPKYVSKDMGVPFLSMRNVTLKGFLLNDMKYVSQSDHEDFCKRTKPEIDDIIYTKGGTTGIAIVNDLDMEFSVWVHLAVLKIAKKHLFPRYIAMALNSPHCYEQSQRYTHGTGNRDLGLTRMVLITMPLPPIEEQKRIVTKVDQLMTLCDKLETKLNKAQQHSEKLMVATVRQILVA